MAATGQADLSTTAVTFEDAVRIARQMLERRSVARGLRGGQRILHRLGSMGGQGGEKDVAAKHG